MKPRIDVFVVGDATGLPRDDTEDKWPVSLRLLPTGTSSIAEFASSPIAAQLSESEADLVAIVVGQDRDALVGIVTSGFMFNALPELSAAIMVAQIDHEGSVVDPTQSFMVTNGIRILLAPRAAHGPVVIRRRHFHEVGPLRPVADPIWDWIIRSARAGNLVQASPLTETRRPSASRLPLLVPRRPAADMNWLREHLKTFSPKDFRINPASKVDEAALRAGLFQWHDFLDESHQLSQSIEGEGEDQLGDYWHAIMHRREPDYSNAKYWFRQIGRQQIFRPLQKEADATLAKLNNREAGRWRDRLQPASKWDPFAFVDMCEACAEDETTDLACAARRIQYIEMSLLMGMTVRQCGGDDAESVAQTARHA